MAFSFKNLASRMTQNNRFAKPPVGGAVPPVNRPVGMAPTAAPIPGPRPPMGAMGAMGPQGPGIPGGRLQQLAATGPQGPRPPMGATGPQGPGLGGRLQQLAAMGAIQSPGSSSPTQFKKGGKVKKAKASSASARADGIAKKGKTKGRFV